NEAGTYPARVPALRTAGERGPARGVRLHGDHLLPVRHALLEAEAADPPPEADVVARAQRERTHGPDALVSITPHEVERADTHAARALGIVREVRAPEGDEGVAEERDERAKENAMRDEPWRKRQMVEALIHGVRQGATERARREDHVRAGEEQPLATPALPT